ncbi:MAG: alkaline phosphatase family protein, partial [Bacteroidales bacterium]|nr:alkaline phosphatase family protein [Bacteroidales bacterium]
MILKFLIFLLLPFYLFSQRVNKIPPQKPKLVVGIVIEQMRYDYLYKYWDKLGPNGFKKLVENGAICSDAHLEYAYTQSAPGYATLATGTNPNMHGIIADKWFNRVKESETKAVEDDKFNCIGNFGKNAQNVSPLNLLASTLGDELKLASNHKSKVISISL